MATPEAEETVATPATAESVVAEVVKSAEGGEKEAPKTVEKEEETTKGEEGEQQQPPPTSTEEPTATETPAEATEASTEAAPAEEPTAPFKEESNLVADLKESEKKALEDFKARIVKAIQDSEFKVPKKVVEAPKEPEAAVEATPKEPEVVEAPKEAEAPAVEAPAAAAAAAETTSSKTPATETPSTETSASEAPPSDAPAEGTPAAEAPVVKEKETAPVVEEKETVAPPPEPAAANVVEAPAAEPEAAAVAPVTTTEDAPPSTAEIPAAGETPAAGELETKEAVAPVEEPAAVEEGTPVEKPAETPLVEEEPVDTTPPEDVALWGVPLLHTKGDERTDVILLKFLRARDFNVSLAFEQLKATIIWRKTFNADTLLEEDFGTDLDPVAFNYGKDKEGHPVCYNVYSPFQNKELYAKTFGDSAKLANFIRWRIQVLEKGIKLLNFTAEGPNAMVQITDLKNLPGLGKNEVRSAYHQAVNILQDNYPELVVKQVFINVPWYFSALYAFVSPFVSARTKSKFSRYTPGRTTEALLKFIPGELLPIAYGGLSKPNDHDFEGVEAPATEQVIKAGEKATIEIPVTESSGTVVWDLAVLGYEVTYGAEYVPSAEGSYTTIIEKPKKLASTTEEPLRSSFKVSEPGKIVISIDNAARKKKIALYRYTVKTPTAEPGLAG